MKNNSFLTACFLVLALSVFACRPGPTPQALPAASPVATTSGNDAPPAATAVSTPQTTGRQTSPTTIPFTTLDQQAPLGDRPTEPLFTVVGRADQWNTLQDRLPGQAFEAGVETARGGDQLIVIVFAGVKGSSGYTITVDRIEQVGDQLRITVSETKPDPNAIVEPARTLPYHLVTLPEQSLDVNRIQTVLFQDSQGNLRYREDSQFF